MLITTAFIWGIGFVAQNVAMDYMEPFIFNAVRFGLGGLSLIPVILIMNNKSKASEPQLSDEQKLENRGLIIRAGLCGGGVLFLAAATQQFGIAITGSASKAGFITGLYIVLVPILGIFFGRKTTGFVWIGAVSSVVGLYLLSVTDGFGAIDIGDGLLLLCAFGWAAHILVIDRFVEKVKPLTFAAAQCLVCAAASLVAAIATEEINLGNIIAGYQPVMFSAFISVCFAYTLQIIGQKHVPPGKSAVIFSMESVFAALAEVVLLGTFLTGRGYVGSGFIFAGILISQIQLKNKSKVEGIDET